ncbi:MAG: UDP-N-acetylglucosamine--N-acetylmuramyl-(pentapeptide) pyrophosphoryl-undecaprenol N-acetylglucosamine transferase [Candidatus Peregrinibacteria bacterium]|nr:UDP-N-acetylglucosamine--N-acetylmuramyl-(pentapeptide) pyrophosphoryl-undecaprenol N-acetylglucosamine transferase [Candidatus Peregrinibacteria bacterium]MCB9807942.1 UDP-N-acetylglucosamine--N-acetylmuramyl-(pentapeptide) pyrophosphoryl-undecaprenol N-acetylglucosamine transferase [Candidatus Peribacteria bacterium]
MQTILFVGGGSVGHIAPSVAVWDACKTLQPDLSAHFICSPRQDDAAFLKKNTLPFTVLNAPRASLLFPVQFVKAVRSAKQILDAVKPDIIFSKGGYVSLPICFEAHRRKIPIILHESDAVSGYANTIVSRWATHVCTGFPTGNPIRKEITEGSKKEARRITGFDGSKPVLLVMGGSQGATSINEAIIAQLDDLLLRCDIIHITGRNKGSYVPLARNYYATEFANEELKHFYALADIALSRAGAGSIAELVANDIPSILVPLRGVGHDHQYKNALAAVESSACIHLEQKELRTKLLPTVHTLSTQTHHKKPAASDAALQIAKIIVQTLDYSQRHQ